MNDREFDNTIIETVPSQPNPPVVGKVTHHSIELSWHPPSQSYNNDKQIHSHNNMIFCVQENNMEKMNGFMTVYEGPDLHNIFTGLSCWTQYRYRVRCSNNTGPSPWSPVVTVSTTRLTVTSENLHKAVQYNDLDKVRTIIEENPIYLDAPDIYGSSPLMAACKKGKKKMVDLLISHGADPEYSNNAGKTCLMEACYFGQNECVMLVHSAGASWLSEDKSGMTALHYAVSGGKSETVELLLTQGVPVDSIGESSTSKWTPLLKLAGINGSVSVARILIRHRADMNRRDKDGHTPLILACITGNTELVELLLHYGANPSIQTQQGKSVLEIAMASEKEEIVKLLKKAVNKG